MTERTHLDYVCEMFECVSTNSSRNVKEELLRKLTQDPVAEKYAKELLSIALDWFRHFGVATLPESEVDRKDVDPDMFFKMVENIEKGMRYTPQMIANTCAYYKPITEHWLRRCILKDLKMGASTKTIHKIWPGLIRTFECQLAEDLHSPDEITEWPVIVEPKVDGVRGVAILKDGKLEFISRGGQELFNLEPIRAELMEVLNGFGVTAIVLDGEFFVGSLQATMSVVRSSVNQPDPDLANRIKFHIFDIISSSEWETGVFTTAQSGRTSLLRQIGLQPSVGTPNRVGQLLMPGEVAPTLCHTPQEVETCYERCLSDGFEGLMVKEVYATYSFKRSQCWRKYKPYEVDHYSIVGSYEGEGKHEGRLGGFVLQLPKDKTCKVGGGFSDKQREDYFSFADTLVGKIVRVKFKEKTPDGLLREPVFLGFV